MNLDQQGIFQWELDAASHETAQLPSPDYDLTAGKLIHRSVAGCFDSIANATKAREHVPGLSQCMIEDDSVCVALAKSLNHPLDAAIAIYELLSNCSIDTDRLSFVIPAETGSLLEQLQSALPQVRIEQHQPDNQDAHAYLAADDAADPIYVNRTIIESDFVLPVVPLISSSTFLYHGLCGIAPDFLDTATATRIRLAAKSESLQSGAIRSTRSDEIAYLLGCLFFVGIVQPPRERPSQFAWGSQKDLETIATRIEQSNLSCVKTPIESELVMARLQHRNHQSIWDEVCSAFRFAESMSQSKSTLIVSVDTTPSLVGALRYLADFEDSDQRRKRLLGSKSITRPHAMLLSELMESHRLILHVPTASESLEQAGFGIATDLDQITKTASNAATRTYIDL